MTVAPPAVANHNAACQRARDTGCDCFCGGMIHQRDILVAAIDSRGTPANFGVELTHLFGTAFSTLSTNPIPPQESRRIWTPIASAGTGKQRSQVEQRVVDTTLRDIMRIVHAMPVSAKIGWSKALDDLTLQTSWHTVITAVRATIGTHTGTKGFFWASMLAATSGVLSTNPSPSASDITNFPSGVSTVFDEARHPRASSGNTVGEIPEMKNTLAMSTAARPIAAALAANATMPISSLRTVLAVVGSALSADLWRHPAAVRYLLLPAVTGLRGLTTATFSLDSPTDNVEDIIDRELATKWHGNWVW